MCIARENVAKRPFRTREGTNVRRVRGTLIPLTLSEPVREPFLEQRVGCVGSNEKHYRTEWFFVVA